MDKYYIVKKIDAQILYKYECGNRAVHNQAACMYSFI